MQSENNKSKMQKKNIEKYKKYIGLEFNGGITHTQAHHCITNCCVNFISLSVKFILY